MEEMPQYHFFQPGPESYTYISTPSPQQSILSSSTYASQQLTPHTEHSDYGFPDAHIARSNSEPFLAYPHHIVPSIAPPVGPPAKFAIPPSHYRGDDKQKNKRTAVACESCRNKKTKCDGDTVNKCTNCKDQKLECAYRETPPSKKDNQMNEMLEQLQALTSGMRTILKKMGEYEERIARYEQQMQQRQCWQCGTSQFPVFPQ